MNDMQQFLSLLLLHRLAMHAELRSMMDTSNRIGEYTWVHLLSQCLA
jgi:hypothetical protein